jgi:hypothetical protein
VDIGKGRLLFGGRLIGRNDARAALNALGNRTRFMAVNPFGGDEAGAKVSGICQEELQNDVEIVDYRAGGMERAKGFEPSTLTLAT